MANRWLNEIYEIEGVDAVIVSSNIGKIIDKICKKLTNDKLEGIALYLLRIVSANYLKGNVVKDIEIFWENYHVIAKISSKFILISICTSPRILSLLRITQNVVLSHLLEDKKFMKLVKKHASEKSVVLRKGKLDASEINLISKLQ